MKTLTKTLMQMKTIRNLAKSILIYLALLMAFTIQAAADSSGVKLELKPPQCIALHQGQECYVNIELTWTAEQSGDYCLFTSLQTQQLECWQNKQQSVFKREIVASENVIFSIKAKGQQDVLASAALEMAWVYKKKSRSHLAWRLF